MRIQGLIAAVFATGVAILAAGHALAQEASYPSRPLRIVVAYPPGGGNDVAARILGARLQERLGQPVIVDNKPGAAGQVGTAFVAKAPADGYTILLTNPGPHAVSQTLQPDLPYDVNRDFAPITVVATMPFFIVVPAASPYRTLADLLAAEKANPGKFNFSSAGIGSLSQIAGEMVNRATNAKLVHVPYKGAAPQITDTVAGRVEMGLMSAVDTMPQLNRGALRALATTGRTRSPLAPDVPTMIELGFPDFEVEIWYAMFAPAGTPPAIVARLNSELAAILTEPAIQARFKDLAAVTAPSAPHDLAALVARDVLKYGDVIRAANIKPD